MSSDVVIVSGVRTPIATAYKGSLLGVGICLGLLVLSMMNLRGTLKPDVVERRPGPLGAVLSEGSGSSWAPEPE